MELVRVASRLRLQRLFCKQQLLYLRKSSGSGDEQGDKYFESYNRLVRDSVAKLEQLDKTYSPHITNESGLTHVDVEGKVNMVDIVKKAETDRTAEASGFVYLGQKAFELVEQNNIAKGDVIAVAKTAGIMAVKRTSDLIPLCHNISLSWVDISLELDNNAHGVKLTCKVRCRGQTGAEMEALTGVSVAALTIYDMCKAVSRDIVISDIKLMAKSGGKSGTYIR